MWFQISIKVNAIRHLGVSLDANIETFHNQQCADKRNTSRIVKLAVSDNISDWFQVHSTMFFRFRCIIRLFYALAFWS